MPAPLLSATRARPLRLVSRKALPYLVAVLTALAIFYLQQAIGLSARGCLPGLLCAVVLASWDGTWRAAVLVLLLGLAAQWLGSNYDETPAHFALWADACLALSEIAALMFIVSRRVRKSRLEIKDRVAEVQKHADSAAQALKAAEDFNSAILASIDDSFVALDRNWHFTYVNRQAAALTRKQLPELYGKCIWQVFPELVGSPLAAALQKVMLTGKPSREEFSSPDGQQWFEVHTYAAKGGITSLCRDISARKLAELEHQKAKQALRQSNDRLRFAQRCAHAATWDWDLSSGIVTVSDEYFELYGIKPQLITYDFYLRLLPADDRAEVIARIEACLQGDGHLQLEFRYLHPDKGLRWLAAVGSASGERCAAGKLTRMGGIVLDITPQKTAQEDRARLSTIVETSSDAIMSEVDGVITSWNAAAEFMFGYSAHEMLGQPLQRLIPSLPAHPICPQANPRVEHREGEGIRRDGTTLWLSLSVSPICDPKGMVVGMATIARDITDKKRQALQNQFLAASADVLSSSLDDQTGLAKLAKLSVPSIADWCLIFTLADDSNLRLTAIAHADETLQTWGEKVFASYRAGTRDSCLLYQVLRSGRPHLARSITAQDLAQWAHNDEHLTLLKQFQARSMMILPVTCKQRSYGVIVLSSCSLSRLYQDDDLDFGMELGRRAALASENARLYAEAQQALAKYERELAERKRGEMALRLNERIYHTIGEAINYGIWICDSTGSNIYMSESFLQLTGMKPHQCAGSGWTHSLHPDEAEAVRSAWRRCVEDQAFWDQEYRCKGSDGAWHSILSRGAAVRDEQGQIIYWAGLSLDISGIKQTEDALRIAKNDADAANAAKSAFLANMSHEIRTPLGAILGFSDILACGGDDASLRQECLAAIQRNGHLLSKIINDILDLSKVEAGRLGIEKSLIALPTLIEEVTSSLALQASAKGIELIIKEHGPMPLAVITDPLRLKQILNNLIGNAIKFTERGEVEVILEVAAAEDRNTDLLLVHVRDTGIGLSRDYLGDLFQPFSQADPSYSRKQGGTGLGLTLSRHLARLLGGDIVLDRSELGKGSHFVLSIDPGLPMTSPLTQTPLGLAPALPPQKLQKGVLRGLKVLLVEDAPDNQLLMKRILHMAGAQLEIACNGRQGVNRALAETFDVVLMDVQMPVMDGFEATRLLRQHGFAKPIIAITAHALVEERKRCLAEGFSDHISKPVNRQILVDCLKSLKLKDTSLPSLPH